MELVFSAPLGDFGIRREVALLFRDNVQHQLQLGSSRADYPLVHAMADAPTGGEILRFDASLLWAEVSEAFEQIRSVGIDELVVGVRTRSTLAKTGALPAARGIELARLAGGELPLVTRRVHTLGEVFDDLVKSLGLVTDAGFARGVVDIALREDSSNGERTSWVHLHGRRA